EDNFTKTAPAKLVIGKTTARPHLSKAEINNPSFSRDTGKRRRTALYMAVIKTAPLEIALVIILGAPKLRSGGNLCGYGSWITFFVFQALHGFAGQAALFFGMIKDS